MIFKWFKKKKQVVNDDKLDPMSEDCLKVEGAVLVLAHMSKKYGVAGMDEMSTYLGKRIGNEILNAGLRNWEI